MAVNDSNGLPDTRLKDSIQNPNLLRTDRNGWIEITNDGEQMWVEAERSR